MSEGLLITRSSQGLGRPPRAPPTGTKVAWRRASVAGDGPARRTWGRVGLRPRGLPEGGPFGVLVHLPVHDPAPPQLEEVDGPVVVEVPVVAWKEVVGPDGDAHP